MRKYRFCSTILLVFVFAASAWPQDPKSLLQSTLSAHVSRSQVNDLVLTGSVRSDGGPEENLRVYISGNNVRSEIGAGSGTRINIRSTEARQSQNKVIPAHAAVLRPRTIPFLDLITEINNPRAQIIYRGLKQIGGRPVHQVSIALPDASPQSRPFGRALSEAVDFYIDVATLWIVRTERMLTTAENMDLKVPSIMEFSDYRLVNGVAVPFRIVETVGTDFNGLHQITTTLQSVAVNQGVSPALFLAQ